MPGRRTSLAWCSSLCLALGLWQTVAADALLVLAFLSTVAPVAPRFPLVIAPIGKPDRDW